MTRFVAVVVLMAIALKQAGADGDRSSLGDRPANIETVNLDDPPEQRWVAIAQKYKAGMLITMDYVVCPGRISGRKDVYGYPYYVVRGLVTYRST